MKKNRLNKKDLCKLVNNKLSSSNIDYSGRKVTRLMNIFLSLLKNIVLSTNVHLKNLGTFSYKNRKERIGRNPLTMKEYKIAKRSVLTFSSSKILLKNINDE